MPRALETGELVMTLRSHDKNRRVLVIDDNPAIHDDFRKILCNADKAGEDFEAAEAALFGAAPSPPNEIGFEIDSAFQGEKGLERVEASLREGRPYALAFVDVRMPPGWDGVETIRRIWQVAPDLQVVMCTAYSDYSWDEIVGQLGTSDNLFILRKPFDNIEVMQLAHALTRKWTLGQALQSRLAESEERFRVAFDVSPVAMEISTLAEGRVVEVNEAYLRLLGFERDQVVGHTAAELGVWADGEGSARLLPKLHEPGSVRNVRCRLRTRAGELREALMSAELIRVGGTPSILLVFYDATERILEEQVLQAENGEVVGPERPMLA